MCRCNQIPESIAGVDLETVGYHQGCYQKFTKNQDCLKSCVVGNETSTSHSPCKTPSTMQLFPPECVFCKKNLK